MPLDPPLRRSNRITKQPAYLTDYDCSTKHQSSALVNLVSSNFLSPSHLVLLSSISSYSEPSSYIEASKDPNWVLAMKKEIDAL